MLFVIILTLLLLFQPFTIYCSPIYKRKTACKKSCPNLDESRINIHLVPHSHDDVGWLQTVDGYYFGTAGERTYEHAGVQYIISSTVEALKQNPNRRFIQVETAFLWKWWQYQPEQTRQDFQNLVNNGQIEIINGAWSMNDEACTNYQSIIDQFTYGFVRLNETLGVCAQPKIGWQIDPFGHSREHASIMKQLGFDGLIIGRLDYRDKSNRKSKKSLDFLWRTSENFDNNQLFTSMFPDFYLSVNGFCFDITCTDQPLITDKNSPLFNIDKKIDQFSTIMETYATYYRTRNILIPMGGDFHFQAAEINFINIDRLIEGFKNNTSFNVFYSTPSCYIEAVNQELNRNSRKLPEKLDDFFPYASDPNSFWAGFYTSRPTQKRYERIGNNLLQATKQLTSLYVINTDNRLNWNGLIELKEVMGVMQHHDAITGTEKQFVANDYARMLTRAIQLTQKTTTKIISDLLQKAQHIDQNLNLEFCLLANISVCEPSNNQRFMVAVYNPLGWIVDHFIRLPVQDGIWKITGPDGEEIYDLVDSLSDFDYLPADLQPSPKEIVFKASNLPPLGVKLYYIERVGDVALKTPQISQGKNNKNDVFTIDSNTGLLKSIMFNGNWVEVKQELLFYKPSVGNNEEFENRSSGAYIFRPNSTQTAQPMYEQQIKTEEFIGNLMKEIKQIISEEASQIIRYYYGSDYIEFDWLIGNLNTDKEVITRYTMKDLINNGVFYTDSNGREMIKRQLNKRIDYDYDPTIEPISGNYYPITTQITINDTMNALTILVDRSEGGASLTNGSIELMLHRRLLHDDAFGVNEALNEEQYGRGLYARGQHYLLFNKTDESLRKTRILALKKLLQPIVLIGDATADQYTLENLRNSFNFKFDGLKNPLPDSVHLLTFEPWSNNDYLVRFEHVLERRDDTTGPVTVDLQEIFPFNITNIKETTLGGNQLLEEFNNERKFIWNDYNVKKSSVICEDAPLKINLNPMQIRTFIITVGGN